MTGVCTRMLGTWLHKGRSAEFSSGRQPDYGYLSFSAQCSMRQRGADLYREKSLTLVPNWSILMQRKIPNPHSLVQKELSQLVRMDYLDWSVKMLISL